MLRATNAREVDQRAAWRAFAAWARRFEVSARRPTRRVSDKLYLCDCYGVQCEDFGGEVDPGATAEKIAFLRAYVSLMALDSGEFSRQTKRLLVCQGRLRAPRCFGVWFYQSDMALFGAGGSAFFQGHQASLFCEEIDCVDIADVSAILPFDELIIRHPSSAWSDAAAQAAVAGVRRDLAFDGMETEIPWVLDGNLLLAHLESPDYGIPLDDEDLAD